MTAFLIDPATGPLDGTCTVPGDKSIGHRALMLAALCRGKCEIRGLSAGEDNARTRVAMSALGATIIDLDEGVVQVHGVGLDGLRGRAASIECGNSGTTMRLLTGLLAGQRFDMGLTGDESLSRRPMRRVIEPLSEMGARIRGATRADRPGEVFPPLLVTGHDEPLAGIDIELAIASAQVKSAILLAGLFADGPVTVTEPGPSRDHTERMLAYLGVPLVMGDCQVSLDVTDWNRRMDARPLSVPGDPSSAAFIIAAALVTGAERVVIRGVGMNATRTGFLDAVEGLGARVSVENLDEQGTEPTADLVVETPSRGAGLSATTVSGDLTVRAIDELPILAVLAARADGTTHITDAAELRVKESDRIATTVAMLQAFGVDVEERRDGLSIHGQPGARLSAAHVDAKGDHRIAMSAAVAALIADGQSRIEDTDNVATSFPGFAQTLCELAKAPLISVE